MPKVLWIALPLLAVAAWLGWRWVRRRPPSRRVVNVAISLLLLFYVVGTAALGVFWVANQQLPVFDWHYLFGYATLLVVALHLGLNWRIVWNTLARPVGAGTASPAPRRRALLGTLGAAAGLAAAFWAGRWTARGAAGEPVASMQPDSRWQTVERFHALSSHTRGALRAPGLDWGQAPAPFKHFPRAERIALHDPAAATHGSVDLPTLTALLWHTAGITARRATLLLRAAPSSGGLFPCEFYLAVGDLPGITAGLWHYAADGPALQRVGRADRAASVAAVNEIATAAGAVSLPDGTAIVVASAVFGRSEHKYGDRAYRYVVADFGHALENLCVAAREIGLRTRIAQSFDEARCAAALGLDEAVEGVLGWVAIGPAASSMLAAAPVPRAMAVPARDTTPGRPTTAIHAATSWRAATLPAPPRPPEPARRDAGTIALSAGSTPRRGQLSSIAVRRSVRRFSDTALGRDDLAAVLASLTASDALTQALRIDLVVHAVHGLDAGAYRYQLSEHALAPRRRGMLRGEARIAALEQDVIGNAQAVIVVGVDREALRADPLDAARGYRHALAEAGRIGERVYLAAEARDLAACSVGAFYDEEAARLVGVDPAREWVLHFVALGVPD